MFGQIYKITNKVNNKVYIGKTVQKVEKRFKQHINHAKNPEEKHKYLCLYNAMRKYGYENFVVEPIDTADTLEELDAKEKFWIEEYHSFIDDPQCWGYNMTIGGDGGHWCKESFEKAKATKKRHGTDHHSELTKQKISQAHKGKILSDEHKKHLSENHHLKTTHVLYYKDGHIETTTDSLQTLATKFNTTASKLKRASEIASFRATKVCFVLDITDLGRAFNHNYIYSKEAIVIDPLTNEIVSPVYLHAKYQHNMAAYNFIYPELIFIPKYASMKEAYIKQFEELRSKALK